MRAKVDGHPLALRSLSEMESTGGEPDVINHDRQTGVYPFCDCLPESPAGRRSLSSSWIQTPADVRKLGGALFCDRRYGKVFVYHNGAPSYYAARGFRGSLRV